MTKKLSIAAVVAVSSACLLMFQNCGDGKQLYSGDPLGAGARFMGGGGGSITSSSEGSSGGGATGGTSSGGGGAVVIAKGNYSCQYPASYGATGCIEYRDYPQASAPGLKTSCEGAGGTYGSACQQQADMDGKCAYTTPAGTYTATTVIFYRTLASVDWRPSCEGSMKGTWTDF